MRIIRNGLLVILLILVLVLAFGFFYVRRSLPKTEGAHTLTGLNGQVEVVRDADGVPHIFAATDHDAFFALGYVHAQDRMWQMEMQRRIGAGRLSEILGDATLDTDKFLRTLGTYRSAKQAWDALSPETQADIEAYVAGVNAWLDEKHVLPPEFLILGVKPEPWTVYDSMVWAKMMSWNLGGNYDMELLRVRLAQAVGEERAAQLTGLYPDAGETILAANTIAPETASALLRVDSFLQTDFNLRGLDIGSNNWVVAGSRTDSGQPLLANDPHLGAQIPSIWYLAEIQGEKIHVTGATFPGMPFFPTGHNEHIAWGVTNLGPDVQDLYMERINPQNPDQYEVNGSWVDMDIVEEPIYVKGKDDPILWAARSTRHGPLISDVSKSTPVPVALQWTALEPDDTTVEAFLDLNYASNWDEFTAALEKYIAPSQNFVYADTEGNIGYYAPGLIPIRRTGNGMVPVPGWTDEYKWSAWIPFPSLPHAFNPEAGYIVTANNRAVPDDYRYFITNDWTPPYRAQRIAELIREKSSAGEKISVDDMAAIQADQFSTQARELLPYLKNIEPADDRQQKALAYVQNWDGNLTTDSIATTIYEAWQLALLKNIFADDLHGDLFDDFVAMEHPVFLNDIFSDPKNTWCDNFLTTPTETCGDIAAASLADALDILTEKYGKNMKKWRWGDVHHTEYPHNPFSHVDALKKIFDRNIANGGDRYTVNVAPYHPDKPFEQYHVPSYREIVDMSNLNGSLFMHTTGQSGNVLSPHYDDLIERHQRVEYLPMTFGRDRVSGSVLTLKPK